MKAHSLFRQAGIEFDPVSVPDCDVSLVTCDSRKCVPDSVFIAMRGTFANGEQFIDEAKKRGARIVVDAAGGMPVRKAYALLNKYQWNAAADKLNFWAVTGTNGKTTCSFLIQVMLAGKYKTGLIGTIFSRFNEVTIPSAQTTPDPEVLHPLLQRFVEAKLDGVVMETSSHALEQDRLEGIAFDGALITNVTHDHLDYHKTWENYLESKLKLVHLVKPEGTLAVNRDDKSFDAIRERVKGKFVTYGTDPSSDYRIADVCLGLDGSTFTIHHKGQATPFKTVLVGSHNVYNIAGSAVVAHGSGVSLAECASRVNSLTGVPGRMQRVDVPQGFHLFVDYAHTEDAMYRILSSVKPLVRNKLLLLFGCGGERDQEKRPRMAQVAEQYADYTIVTSDNPRREKPSLIAKQIMDGFSGGFKGFEIQLDRRKAIRRILMKARAGDVVIIAGKGHEDYQIIGEEKLPFSDVEECGLVLNGK